MNKRVYLLGASLLVAVGTHATVINFTNVDPDAATVSDGNVLANQTLSDGEAFTTLSYTVNDLTIDTDGEANDSITVTFSVTGTSSGTINWDHNDTNPEWDYNGITFKATGDGISFGTIGVTGTLSSGDDIVVTSAVYDQFEFRRWGGDETVTIQGGETDAYNYDGNSDIVPLSNYTEFSIKNFTANESWNLDDIDFSVTVVPEPATLGLLAIGTIGLLAVRRRFNG